MSLDDLLAGNNSGRKKQKKAPGKKQAQPKEYDEKVYINPIWAKASTEKLMHNIQTEVEYKTKKETGDSSFKYPFGELIEDALKLLAKEKGISYE